MIVRREPPAAETVYDIKLVSKRQAMVNDLAAGRHAVGCGCHIDAADGSVRFVEMNACLHIARCLRDLVAYEVEEPEVRT